MVYSFSPASDKNLYLLAKYLKDYPHKKKQPKLSSFKILKRVIINMKIRDQEYK